MVKTGMVFALNTDWTSFDFFTHDTVLSSIGSLFICMGYCVMDSLDSHSQLHFLSCCNEFHSFLFLFFICRHFSVEI